MKKISRIFLFGALTLMLVLAACAPEEGSPTTVIETPTLGDTASPAPIETDTTGTAETATTAPEATLDTTATVDPAATATTETASIPVTGAETILLECQYCVEGMAHALLVLPDTATFEAMDSSAAVTTSDNETGCHTVDTFRGRQVVLCRAPENSSLMLNICPDGVNCTQLLVELQSCPQTGTAVPGTDTPGNGDTTSTPTPALLPTITTPLVGSPTPVP